MGVPTSEVGYTIATARRETTKVHKNMWWHWGGAYTVYCLIMLVVACLQFGSEVHRNVHIILLWRVVNLNTKS